MTLQGKIITLSALQKTFVDFSSNLPGNLALKNGGEFWLIFLVSVSHETNTKTPQKIRGQFGAKFAANLGRKSEKFGKLSFCNFSSRDQNYSGSGKMFPKINI